MITLQEYLNKAVQSVSGGVLICFKNYSLMEECYENWVENHLFGGKKAFIEKRAAINLDAFLESKGVFFCVNRGKLCEGTDLPDDACRLVIIVGLPVVNISDPYLKNLM